jgi:hypothetical protein
MDKITDEDNKFKYNECDLIDVTTHVRDVPYKKIKIVDYNAIGINLNHRPIQELHLRAIDANFTGAIKPIDLIYCESKDCYYIVNGQHYFKVLNSRIKKGDIPEMKRYACNILYRKSTGEQMNCDNDVDAKLANRYSYCHNSGQRGVVYIDTVRAIYDLGSEYKDQHHGKVDGIYEYLFNNQYGVQKYSQDYIEKIWRDGQALTERKLFMKAINERWNAKKVRDGIRNTKAIKTYNFNVTMFKEQYDKIKENKNDPVFWETILKHS